MVDRYDRNRVVDITDPTVRMTSVLTMTDSKAIRRNVSPILVSDTQSHWFSVKTVWTVSDCPVISCVPVTLTLLCHT